MISFMLVLLQGSHHAVQISIQASSLDKRQQFNSLANKIKIKPLEALIFSAFLTDFY